MIIENLRPGQVIRPTKDADTTFARKIEKNEKQNFVFRRVLKDGSTGSIIWAGHASMKAWARKHGAVIDGARQAPPFDSGSRGVQFFAKDSDGQWHYVNHAGTWQGCPPPVSVETPNA